MNDEIVEAMRNSLAQVHMDRPVEAIDARARIYRRTRRLAGLTGLTGLVVAAATGLALIQPGGGPAERHHGAAPANGTPASVPERMELASFTLQQAPDGRVTVNFKEAAADPAALERALSGAGIAAVVRVNEACASRSGAGEAVNLDNVIRMHRGQARGFTVDGAALPDTVGLGISLSVDDRNVVRSLLINLLEAGAPVTCERLPKRLTSPR